MHKFSSTVLLQTVNCVRKVGVMSLPLFMTLILLLSGCEAGIYHTVRPGQTLYRISRTYNVDEGYLARVNGIGDPSQIAIGTRIFVPGAQRVLPVQVVKTKTISQPKQKTTTKVTKKPAQTNKKPVVVTQKKTTIKKKPTSSITQTKSSKSKATSLKRLQWPLRGKIVRTFSKQATAGGGKGIEIAVRSGSDVSASEAGKVIYSGDGVNGYGFLVILQHENDLFTVYGFNQKNLVHQGDFVSKGERIALSGAPPSGGKARLHFEVRKGKIAVDPLQYLP